MTPEETRRRIDDLEEAWEKHRGGGTTLADFLGLTEAEHDDWARYGELPDGYVPPEVPLDPVEVVEEFPRHLPAILLAILMALALAAAIWRHR